jgi:hypothetical protein
MLIDGLYSFGAVSALLLSDVICVIDIFFMILCKNFVSFAAKRKSAKISCYHSFLNKRYFVLSHGNS